MALSLSLSCACTLALAPQTSANFIGYSVDRVITAAGNTQYKVYANFTQSNYTFLNAFNWVNHDYALNARHQDAAEDLDGNPSQSWSASVNLLGTTARDNDSWVTASGSGTSAGNDAALDPGFNPSNTGEIPNGAGWFDATPGTANLIAAGGASGYRILVAQIVRTGDDAGYVSTHCLDIAYKVNGTSAAIFGTGSFQIGVPAPGALAGLLALGFTTRRRRS
jgi:galactokinase